MTADVAEMILDGSLCELCSVPVDGETPGYPPQVPRLLASAKAALEVGGPQDQRAEQAEEAMTAAQAAEALWLPIESAPRDGSYFVTCKCDEDDEYEVGQYRPYLMDKYVEAAGGLFEKQSVTVSEFTHDNFHRATPLDAPAAAPEVRVKTHNQ